MSAERCQRCDQEFATSYPVWQMSDTTCGMSPAWNEHGGHEDCINECLYAAVARLNEELEAQREKSARAERDASAVCARVREQKAELRSNVARLETENAALRKVAEEAAAAVHAYDGWAYGTTSTSSLAYRVTLLSRSLDQLRGTPVAGGEDGWEKG